MRADNCENSDEGDECESKRVKPRANQVFDQSTIDTWTREQSEMRQKLILSDTEPWQQARRVYRQGEEFNRQEHLRYIAGMDISFVKDDKLACSGLFVFDVSDEFKMVYQDLDTEPIIMDQPYAPGFLAYREAPFLLNKLDKLRQQKPELYPQCILIDGNGKLHVNKFGMACHIGYHSDTPTIGVSKKLFQVFGLENSPAHKERIKRELQKAGDHFELLSNEPEPDLLGYCYRSTKESTNPIYVSVGNKIGWSTCLWIVQLAVRKYRIPEPIRQADLLTREYLRTLKF